MDPVPDSDDPPLPPPTFAFDRLPPALQESILLLLPIPTLLACTSVSRSFRSLIHSPSFTSSFSNPDPSPLFLLFSPHLSYSPSLDRPIPLPLPFPISAIHSSSSSLLLAEDPSGQISVLNPFTKSQSPHRIPPMIPVFQPYFLALAEASPPSDFQIVAVSTVDRVYSQIYDSRSRKWELKGGFNGQFAVIGDGVVLDGLIYCLGVWPDHLLTFDPATGEWRSLDVEMPAGVVCSHLLAFEKGLFLVGGVEDVGVVVKIGMWEMEWKRREWRVRCFMPEEIFEVFRGGGLNRFETVDRGGIVCFYNMTASVVLMCDLKVEKWWWPRKCEGVDGRKRCWFGHAVEPHIDLVKRLSRR